MALEGPGKFFHYEGPRMLIYVSQIVGTDSTFPFKRGDKLWIRVDAKNQRVIITKGRKGKTAKKSR
jgi:hypothetical protein